MSMLISLAPIAGWGQEIVWTSQFGSASNEGANVVSLGHDGNIYVAGGTLGTLPGQSTQGGNDAFVCRYSPDGTETGTLQYGSSADDGGNGVAVDAGGNIYVSGGTSGVLPNQTNAGGNDAFVRKYDANSQEVWTRQFGTANNDFATRIEIDPSGNPCVVGCTWGVLPDQASAGGQDIFVRKYDSDGNELWTRQFGTSDNEGTSGIAVDSAGNIYVAGGTSGVLPDQTNVGNGDAFIRKYNAAGNEVWTRQFGTSGGEGTSGVAVGPDGNVYVSGGTTGAFPV